MSGSARAGAFQKYHFYQVKIGTLSLFMDCVGTGSPTVIFEAGAGLASDTWIQVLPPLFPGDQRATASITARYCAYDRAGEGQSNPDAPKHDAETVVHTLRQLLTKAGIPGPYVLVGHSIGGLYVRMFAYTYPKQVVGMVLVDAVHEDGWAAEVAGVGVDPATCTDGSTFCEEVSAYKQDQVEMDAARKPLGIHSLGSMPLVVLTATDKPQPGLGEWLHWQHVLAGMSTNSRQLLDPLTQHDIQLASPEFVIEAVQKVLAAVRTHSQLPPVKDWRCGDGSGYCKVSTGSRDK